MSVLDSIDDFVTDTLTVQRSTPGAPVDGIYPASSTATFTCDAVVQPAYNLNRVVGGADLHALLDGQSVTDVRQLHTRTLLKTRTPTTDPDVIIGLEDVNWTVIRVEKWVLDDEAHYHCVIAKQTSGGS